MDSIANKLDAIAEQLSQVFYTNAEKQPSQKIIQGKEIALSLYRYNHQNSMEQNPALHDEIQKELFEHALSLHLPIEPCEFHIQSEAGPLTFNAGTETIIVTVGKQLEVTWILLFIYLFFPITYSLMEFISRSKITI